MPEPRVPEATFGGHVRELRIAKKWTLQRLADATGISYSHLSRLENDSSTPNPETVANLAAKMDGDLKHMLELADNLPRAILDRISKLDTANPGNVLPRAAYLSSSSTRADLDPILSARAREAGIPARDVPDVVEAVQSVFKLSPARRKSLVALILSLREEEREEHR